MRFHILAVPHTVSTPEYSTCAFTQKVVKLCKMLTRSGHYVIHYGHEDSKVECSEHVTVTTGAHMAMSYPNHDWKTQGWPKFAKTDMIYNVFYRNANAEIMKRKRPGDFLLCSFGDWHREVGSFHKDLLVVEPGIGYPDGSFAPFRVFESYAVMHTYQGQSRIKTSCNDFWHDAVIPNAFDLTEFKFKEDKKNYFLFLGRVTSAKGVHIAAQISRATKTPLIVAGHGQFDLSEYGPQIKKVGVVGPAKRRKLLSDAAALIAPSTFMEPFCGVQIEAMLSGTPVISTDWGAFTEYNLHGTTGFRCKTFEQFEWAARNIHEIAPQECRSWAEKFSLENIAPMYDEYFQSVANSRTDKGWYTANPDRTDLSKTSF